MQGGLTNNDTKQSSIDGQRGVRREGRGKKEGINPGTSEPSNPPIFRPDCSELIPSLAIFHSGSLGSRLFVVEDVVLCGNHADREFDRSREMSEVR